MVCERPLARFARAPPHEGEITYSPPREGEAAEGGRGSLTHHLEIGVEKQPCSAVAGVVHTLSHSNLDNSIQQVHTAPKRPTETVVFPGGVHARDSTELAEAGICCRILFYVCRVCNCGRRAQQRRDQRVFTKRKGRKQQAYGERDNGPVAAHVE